MPSKNQNKITKKSNKQPPISSDQKKFTPDEIIENLEPEEQQAVVKRMFQMTVEKSFGPMLSPFMEKLGEKLTSTHITTLIKNMGLEKKLKGMKRRDRVSSFLEKNQEKYEG